MSMDTGQASDRLSRILDEVEGEVPPPTATEIPSEGGNQAAGAGLGSLLGGLTADPAVLSALLPALLSAFGGNAGGSRTDSTGTPPTPSPEKTAVPGRSLPLDRHTALLCAVKPYLGERRQATAETILRLCRVWDALSRAGITPSLLSGLLGAAGAPTPEPTPPPSADPTTGG